MKQIFAPHLGRHVKLGRKRPVARAPRLHLRRYLKEALPTPPDSVDYSSKATDCLSNVYKNDALGDCVIAAGYHIIGVETGNADDGAPFIATDDQIIADYSAIGGYDPNNPTATDNGCDEQTALHYWMNNGFADGSKLQNFLAVDATDANAVKTALWLFENLFFGIELPDSWINPFPSAPGFAWDNDAPDPQNGHAICGVGYDANGVQIDTWGLMGTMTWEAIAALCVPSAGGELYVLLTPDQIAAGQDKAPNGFDWATLAADFEALGGATPAPPAPDLPPSVTLQDAQAWAAAGLAAQWPSTGKSSGLKVSIGRQK
jgi:hypothetical protein